MKPVLDFGLFQIPSFYLVISLALCFVLYLMHTKLNHLPEHLHKFIDRTRAFDLALLIMIAGFIGGRTTHIFYEEFDYYRMFPLEAYKFWKGGFVYFGGFVFAFVCSYIYLKSEKQKFLVWADFLTPYLSLSYALGRLGCFLEGCCYGVYCTLPWAINQKHPTQIYMMGAELVTLGLLTFLQKKKPMLFNTWGSLFLSWVTLHSFCRFFIEFYRDDNRGENIYGLSFSQWLSLVFAVSSILIFKFRTTSHYFAQTNKQCSR